MNVILMTPEAQKVYSEMVKTLFGSALVRYWPLWDTSGTAAQELVAGDNATYTNVTLNATGIGDGKTAATYAGTSYTRNYSAALNTAMNKGELTLMCWCKLDVGAWTDGLLHCAVRIGRDAGNYVAIWKNSANNRIRVEYMAGATSKFLDFTAPSYTGWMHLAITVSKANDRMHVYVNGTDARYLGTSGLGSWTLDLVNASCGIGAYSGTAATYPWSGSVAHVMLLSREATDLEVAKVAAGTKSLRGVLGVGDSKTYADWQYMLYDSINSAPFFQWAGIPGKIGVGGATAASMKARCDADILPMNYTPDEILLNLGANDFATIGDGSVWKTNMLYIINAYHTAFPTAKLRVAKAASRGASVGMAVASAKIDEIYAANPWLQPGINEIFLAGADDYATYTTDGVHPNAAGQALVAAAWKTAMGL